VTEAARRTDVFRREPIVRHWAVLAGSGRSAAERFVAAEGLGDTTILPRDALLAPPAKLRKLAREAGADGALVHSLDWQRQANPQLYELALAALPVRERLIVDERREVIQRLTTAQAAARVARIPLDALQATGAIGSQAMRFSVERMRRSDGGSRNGQGSGGSGSWILAVWPGNNGGFGGSTTHISGILGGFRAIGFRIALVTRYPPAAQLERVIDEVKVLEPAPPSHRVNGDVDHIACNRPLRQAGLELARALHPSFVYQRHGPFLLAGARVAEECRLPFVLEWNSSEAWIRQNWQKQFALERLLDPLLVGMEREILARSTLISAVSSEAARMAHDAGARDEKMVVLPNAVDIDVLDAAVEAVSRNAGAGGRAVLGWAGSFGPWHGAEVIVKALAELPREVTLVMIGEGDERAACQSLAGRLGVEDRIEWTGALRHDLALRRLAECDVLVSPHTPLREQPFFGSPTKIFEYMALDRPIVASDLGQIGEILEDGVTARLITPGDVAELVQAVLEVLESPDRGRGLGAAARAEAVSKHTWNDRARTLVARLGIRTGSEA
jgi:glycosyltransferase involved in cell wall biosynthesis